MSDLSSRFTKPKFLTGSPLILLALVLLVLCVLFSLPLIIPIGPIYWDTYIYLDAAQRIKLGQIPAVDFLAPVGALEYYQFYWLQTLFPGGQPTFLAQWSVLISACSAGSISDLRALPDQYAELSFLSRRERFRHL
jgi:hypothetical protein